jgi:hypothetical protein
MTRLLKTTFVFLFLADCPFIVAKTKPCTVQKLQLPIWDPAEKVITVLLTSQAYLDSKATWQLSDWGDAAANNAISLPITVQQSLVADRTTGKPLLDEATKQYEYQAVTITPATPLDKNHIYYLSAKTVHFVDCATTQAVVAPTPVQFGKKPTKPISLSQGTSRTDSDLYLFPTIDGASGTKASYTIDAKLSPEFWLKAPSPQWNPLHPGYIITPGIDLKVSSNPKEDGNSVLFQGLVKILYPTPEGSVAHVLPASFGKTGFVAEADKNFHDINGVFTYTQWFILRDFCCTEHTQLVLEPFIGTEIGGNFKSQRSGAYPYSILRGTFGVHEGFNIFKSSKPILSIEGDYIQRLLLNPEPVYVANSQNVLELQSVGTQPRDHVAIVITYKVTPFVGMSANYEYGSLPPDYTKVDNKYTFGVVIQARLLYRVKPAS